MLLLDKRLFSQVYFYKREDELENVFFLTKKLSVMQNFILIL
jgi:hypothetical protein